mgnify:FL=1
MAIGFPAYHIQRLNLRDTNLRVSVSAALEQTGWTVLETTKHSIRAKIGINLWTFGETIQITFIDDKTIEIHSKCRLPTQIFDWGKNKRNVNTLVNLIEGRCRSYNPKPKKTDVKDAEISTMKIERKTRDSPLVSDKKENDTESDEVPEIEESSMEKLEKLIERRNVGEITSKEFQEMKKEILERKPQVSKAPVKITQEEVHDDRDTIVKESVVSKSSIGSGSSKMQELEKLKEMFDSGFISKKEMEEMKKEILGK